MSSTYLAHHELESDIITITIITIIVVIIITIITEQSGISSHYTCRVLRSCCTSRCMCAASKLDPTSLMRRLLQLKSASRQLSLIAVCHPGRMICDDISRHKQAADDISSSWGLQSAAQHVKRVLSSWKCRHVQRKAHLTAYTQIQKRLKTGGLRPFYSVKKL